MSRMSNFNLTKAGPQFRFCHPHRPTRKRATMPSTDCPAHYHNTCHLSPNHIQHVPLLCTCSSTNSLDPLIAHLRRPPYPEKRTMSVTATTKFKKYTKSKGQYMGLWEGDIKEWHSTFRCNVRGFSEGASISSRMRCENYLLLNYQLGRMNLLVWEQA